MSVANPYKTGSFIATGAKIVMGGDKVGFRPRRVTIWNMTGPKLVWVDGMLDKTGLKYTEAGVGTALTTTGITPTDTGFELLAAADVNVDGETCYYEVVG